MAGLADMTGWLRTFAVEHAVGNWDSFGNRNAQNMYAYKPERGPWKLLIWDFNIVLGNSGSDGPSGDSVFQTYEQDRGMRRIYNNFAFVRTYLRTFQEIADGPMVNANVDPIIDARYAALRNSGVTASSPAPIKTWIRNRRQYLSNYLTNFQVGFSVTSPAGSNLSTDQDTVTISGVAPLNMAELRVNNVSYPITWTNLVQWSVTVPVKAPTTQLVLQGYGSQGQPIASNERSITVSCTAVPEQPRLAISEIMHHPAVPGAEFVEIVNASDRSTVDLSDYRLSGIDYDFPTGTLLGPGQYLVVTADRSAFINAYGTDTAPLAEFPGALNSLGETLRLVRKSADGAQEAVLDEVTYSAGVPWPGAASQAGSSLQLIDASQDNSYPGNWTAVAPASVDHPEWQFVSVTGTAGSSSKLLLYHSPLQPEPDPMDIAGRWDGNIQFPGQAYPFTVTFARSFTGDWSGTFSDSGSTISLVVAVTGVTNVVFSFPPEYGAVQWRGRLAPDGATLSGTFTQPGQSAAFSLRRYDDPEARLGGDVYIDDLSLVAGAIPAAGPNLIRNGDFEAALAGEWTLASNHAATALSQEFKHSGKASLYLVASRGGADVATAVSQALSPLEPGHSYTLSYWYLPSNRGRDLTVRMEDGALLSNHSIHPGKTATPGARNSSNSTQTALPLLLLSEVNPVNTSGIRDRLGHREPWLELYNAGPTSVALKDYYLSTNPNDLAQWTFPAQQAIGPGQWLLVWLDGATAESSAYEIHSGFRPTPSEGLIVLSKRESDHMRPVDALRYSGLAPNQSYGIVFSPSGNRAAQVLNQASPGESNVVPTLAAPIRINEWMANNTRSVLNPASGHYDDWFELYNPNSAAVDLAGYSVTDDLSQPRKWILPAGTRIEALGYLVVWADERTQLNTAGNGLHANFKLSQDGESIGLFAPDSTLVDTVVFGPQPADVAQGCWPDGSASEPRALERPTPGAPNPAPPEQTALLVRVDPASGCVLQWTAQPGQLYQLQYKHSLGDEVWLNLGNPVSAGAPAMSISDPGVSTTNQRFYRLVHLE
jgi:hypothetical protein